MDIPLEKVKGTPVESGLNKITYIDENTYKYVAPSSYAFRYETELGDIIIRLIDWKVDEEGIPDSKNEYRGRVTPNWTVAPFFEHVKQNEYAY